MIDVDQFIEHFFEEHGGDVLDHADIKRRYDPVKAREYYLRTRKLKGRKPASEPKVDPRSKVAYNGKPLPPLGTKLEEDETPEASPNGAKLVDYDPKTRLIKYADGSVYDENKGWQNWQAAGEARTKAAGPKPAPMSPAKQQAVQNSLDKMRNTVNNLADGPSKQAALKRIGEAQLKLNVAKRRARNA